MEGTAQYVRILMLFLWCTCTVPSATYAHDLSNAPARGRSAGCGRDQSGTGNFKPLEMRVFNQVRTYHLRVPSTYEPNRTYPLIFRWHGSGGNGLSGGLDIEFISGNDAIVVGADGLNKGWNNNTVPDELLFNADYDDLVFNTDPVDLLFFDRMLESIENQYCIDLDRIFSYGFSVGGYFTNLLACERGNVLRASAAIAGGLRGGNCKGKVATWLLHDFNDQVVPIAEGKAARDRAIAINGCSTNTVDEAEDCVRYQGCEGAPVVWCESNRFGHNIRSDFAPSRVWKFFLNLR